MSCCEWCVYTVERYDEIAASVQGLASARAGANVEGALGVFRDELPASSEPSEETGPVAFLEPEVSPTVGPRKRPLGRPGIKVASKTPRPSRVAAGSGATSAQAERTAGGPGDDGVEGAELGSELLEQGRTDSWIGAWRDEWVLGPTDPL